MDSSSGKKLSNAGSDVKSSNSSQKYKMLIEEIDSKSRNLTTKAKRITSESG